MSSNVIWWVEHFNLKFYRNLKKKNENKDTFDVHTHLKDAANGDEMNEMMCAENSSNYKRIKKLWIFGF